MQVYVHEIARKFFNDEPDGYTRVELGSYFIDAAGAALVQDEPQLWVAGRDGARYRPVTILIRRIIARANAQGANEIAMIVDVASEEIYAEIEKAIDEDRAVGDYEDWMHKHEVAP